MEKFLSGWRYITSLDGADSLPPETIAVEDDGYLWREDPIIGCSQKVLYGDDLGGIYSGWIECDDHVERPTPNVPFYAWHTSFCS